MKIQLFYFLFLHIRAQHDYDFEPIEHETMGDTRAGTTRINSDDAWEQETGFAWRTTYRNSYKKCQKSVTVREFFRF